MLTKHSGLYTDLYELSMAQGYYYTGRADEPACFDYFFRNPPFKGSYVIFAGLRTLFGLLESLSFSGEDSSYLSTVGFKDDFLQYLLNFRFKGTIHSPEEGDLVFPFEPVVRVEGTLLEAQLIETMLLNILNFESLIATKASRIKKAAGNKIISEFGLRRAHGFGGIQASRASVIGGADSTSNVYSAYTYGAVPAGTQAHSWVQSFSDELTAFRKFAEIYPGNCILLVDTFNTLASGIPNAIRVAKELERKGYKLKGIRLDSGDLAELSIKAREILDKEGMDYVKIIASNQMDEYLIDDLVRKNAPIDIFGVGTSLATGNPDGALDGIYKLSFADGKPKLKISESFEKISLPGLKKIFRYQDAKGYYIADGVVLEDEPGTVDIFLKNKLDQPLKPDHEKNQLLHLLSMKNGKSRLSNKTLAEIRDYTKSQLGKLPGKFKKLTGADVYPVGFSRKLTDLQDNIMKEINQKL